MIFIPVPLLADMEDHTHHEEIMKAAIEELKDVLDNSEQGIYIYLDDVHKTCNERFAKMLGYSSKEWAAVKKPFTQAFVHEESQNTLVHAYGAAMERVVASSIEVTWVSKDGAEKKTAVILVPIEFKGHLMAMHFVEEK